MFMKYKPSYKKIAMGLLSYMPEKKDIQELQDTIELYEEDDQWQLYLWKEKEDIVGVLGLFFHDDGPAELRHLCVNPSYRDEGIGKKMVKTIQERLDVELIGGKDTVSFLGTCMEDKKNNCTAGKMSG